MSIMHGEMMDVYRHCLPNSDMHVLYNERVPRLCACEKLGWEEMQVYTINSSHVLCTERAPTLASKAPCFAH